MPDLSTRSKEKEILDRDDVPFEDIYRNMKELNRINSLLGGHSITIQGVKTLLDKTKTNGKDSLKTAQHHLSSKMIICEIGCGGGDNLAAIHRAFPGNKYHYIGIDIKKECIDTAINQYPGLNAEWVVSDFKKYHFDQKPSVIFSSLFCHHFSNEEIISMLQWMKKRATKGFVINDLHRNVIAYYSIKWLTTIFSKSYLVKNDAPISVKRGFRKSEWIQLLNAAGIKRFTVKWKWAFRHLVIVHND